MKFLANALILSAAVIGSITAADAMPLGSAVTELRQETGNRNIVDAQYYWGGNRYCWYDYGWNGPGFYWCGYAWRRGAGWGGPHGWHHWHHRRDWDRDRHDWRHWDRGYHHDHRGGNRWHGDHGHDYGDRHGH